MIIKNTTATLQKQNNTEKLMLELSLAVSDSFYWLDVFVVLAELLVIEPELIHEVGRHLLDLIVREGLGG